MGKSYWFLPRFAISHVFVMKTKTGFTFKFSIRRQKTAIHSEVVPNAELRIAFTTRGYQPLVKTQLSPFVSSWLK